MPHTGKQCVPFLLLSTRPEDDIAQAEYESFRQLMGLQPDELTQLRVDATTHESIDHSDFSGIVLGGSPYNYSTANKSADQLHVEGYLTGIVRRVIEDDFPLFGACYGVGIVGSTLGGTIDTHYGEPAACITVTQTDAGVAEPLLAGLPRAFAAIVGHKEAARSCPPEATVLATGENCPIQMFRVKQNIFVTQFHPELEEATFKERLIAYKDSGYYAPGEMERVLDTLDGHDLSYQSLLLRNFATRYARPRD